MPDTPADLWACDHWCRTLNPVTPGPCDCGRAPIRDLATERDQLRETVTHLNQQIGVAHHNYALALDEISAANTERDQLKTQLDLPCGSCHPCNNWADETWRRAGRKPPTVNEWDDIKAEIAE